jgi:hypothetical protein
MMEKNIKEIMKSKSTKSLQFSLPLKDFGALPSDPDLDYKHIQQMMHVFHLDWILQSLRSITRSQMARSYHLSVLRSARGSVSPKRTTRIAKLIREMIQAPHLPATKVSHHPAPYFLCDLDLNNFFITNGFHDFLF